MAGREGFGVVALFFIYFMREVIFSLIISFCESSCITTSKGRTRSLFVS